MNQKIFIFFGGLSQFSFKIQVKKIWCMQLFSIIATFDQVKMIR